jgi:c-di-GMP-related signal transduction protein
MFSYIDVLLNKPMQQILSGLPISEGVQRALLGEHNAFRALLDCVIAGETANWNRPTIHASWTGLMSGGSWRCTWNRSSGRRQLHY